MILDFLKKNLKMGYRLKIIVKARLVEELISWRKKAMIVRQRVQETLICMIVLYTTKCQKLLVRVRNGK